MVTKKRREGRFPFPEDVRLMRGSGEYLKRELSRLDEQFFGQFLIAIGLPVLLGAAPIILAYWIPQTWPFWIVFAIVTLALIATVPWTRAGFFSPQM